MPLGDFVDRVMEIIELLADKPAGMKLSEIAQQLDMPKSAAHRLLNSLCQRGFVVQDEMSQRYCMTVKLAAVGLRFLSASGTSDICQPSLDRLARHTGELVRLAVVHDDGLLWIAKAQGSSSPLRYDPYLGNPVDLHSTSVGKAWLVTLDEEVAVALVNSKGFKTTVGSGRPIAHDEASLRAELEVTRKRGYGVSIEEGELGTSAMAQAILVGRDRAAVGVISIAGPAARLTRERMEEFAPVLDAIAVEIAELWPARQVVNLVNGNKRDSVANG
ncbi:IclR family transcriptional regulator [Neorhizobium sp. S3-V5DH]|uniref:IclR family transcriptional regulator n=1 Tax=Neorhizobium sp. S3-V5DH TaxID=2485166 RepID=UPI001048AC2B|nr:IclR family transcriptional regulator [Neorhizobium sp. S3-V5DH]TCV69304.1 IclR family transcriptional regulator [Neorhizobium sp. S3-V5DH]